jgi:hypothetical protein
MASTVSSTSSGIPSALIEAIRALPAERIVEHCGTVWSVSPFDIYSNCPQCGAQIKLRAFSGSAGIEDVFDAMFEWMNQTGADDLVRRRRETIRDDE